MMRWLSLALFLTLVYCSFLGAAYLTSTPAEITTGPGALAPILTGIIAVGSITLALKTAKGEVRCSWQMLLIGIGMWVAADLIWGAQEVWGLNQEATFLFADFLWVAGYLPIAAALWFYMPALGNFLRDIRKLIVIIVICILPLVVFGLQLGSLISSAAFQESGWFGLVPALYPILDTFLAAGGLLIVMFSRHHTWRWPWFLIGAALVLWSYSDVLYAVAVISDAYFYNIPIRLAVDLSYTLAYLILAVGATLSLQTETFSFAVE
jgi:hypothetical protein